MKPRLILMILAVLPGVAHAGQQTLAERQAAFEQRIEGLRTRLHKALHDDADYREAQRLAEQIAGQCDAELGEPAACAGYYGSVASMAKLAGDMAAATAAQARADLARRPIPRRAASLEEAVRRLWDEEATLDLNAAEPLLRTALAAPESGDPPALRHRARVTGALALLQYRKRDFDGGAARFAAALTHSERAYARSGNALYAAMYGFPDHETQNIRSRFAAEAYRAGQWAIVERQLRIYLRSSRHYTGTFIQRLAEVVYRQGREDEAWAIYRAALSRTISESAPTDPFIARDALAFAQLRGVRDDGLAETRSLLRLAALVARRRTASYTAYDEAARREMTGFAPIYRLAIGTNWRLAQRP